MAMDRNFALEAVRVTEAASLAAARHLGRGDEHAADTAAARAMAEALSALEIDGTIRVGEGDDMVEALHIGTAVGNGEGPKIDVALRPLEGTSIIARGGYNAISVIALAERGGFLSVPDVYMNKVAVGPGLPEGICDITADPADIVANVAGAKGLPIGDLVVCILDRPRHKDLIAKVRGVGARIQLILDGDVSGALATMFNGDGADLFLGIGGAPQGVLAAAGLRCGGGQMQGKLVIRSDADVTSLQEAGIEDPDAILGIEDMASGDVTFAATGVTNGPLLQGVTRQNDHLITQSLVLRSKTGTWRKIEAHHSQTTLEGRQPKGDGTA